MKTPRFLQIHQDDRVAVREELLAGLCAQRAHTSPKYLYDALGSRLFEAITELPEYYPTRTEAQIFAAHGESMAAVVPPRAALIDLGAGNCNKAAALFDRFMPSQYVAVDISVDFLRNALVCLQRQYPSLQMTGLGLDFSAGLQLPEALALDRSMPRIFFYPGSSIGNFTPEEALAFLRSVHTACDGIAGSGILIGVDLIKDSAELEAAYDDALGVTAAFNRNLLLHINRLAGTDFALADWQHVAQYHAVLSRIEMHLKARRPVTVRWHDAQGPQARHFGQGETIHTENSYKWLLPRFAQLLTDAGFAEPRHWCDPDQRFAVFWARFS
ncbi:MAG: L-histidine N(alpha)-methyltransferase [Betaproteobacteria bacterium]|nr:L-histidine N(alpha)-methyltransferase [Betaproteobacteria bacterium]